MSDPQFIGDAYHDDAPAFVAWLKENLIHNDAEEPSEEDEEDETS